MQNWGKAEFEPSPARREIFYVLMFCCWRYFSVEVNGETKKEIIVCGIFKIFMRVQKGSWKAWSHSKVSLEGLWGFRPSLPWALSFLSSPAGSTAVPAFPRVQSLRSRVSQGCRLFPKGAESQEPPYSALNYWTKHSSIFKRKFRANISETWLKRDRVCY